MAILHLKQSTRLMNMLIQEVHNFFSPISAVKIRVWKRPSETYMLLDHHLERHHLPDLPRSYLPPLQLVQRPRNSQDPSGLVPYADVAFDVGPERQGVATGRFLAHRVVWKPNRLGVGEFVSAKLLAYRFQTWKDVGLQWRLTISQGYPELFRVARSLQVSVIFCRWFGCGFKVSKLQPY